MWNGESLVFHGTSFTGVFDGNAHTISHLTITGSTYLGLFGQLASGAEVKNLGVVDVNVVGSGDCVGGLLALNWLGTVTHCYSTGAVSGSGSVGAVVGSNGEFASPGGVLTNCYSIGVVSGESEVGGLVGTNACPEETTCSAHVTNCFWDIDISGLPNMCGSQHNLATGCNDSFGRTTAEMQTARTFLTATGTTFDRSGVIRGGGWDFVGETKNGTEDIWAICEGLTQLPQFEGKILNSASRTKKVFTTTGSFSAQR